MCTIHLSDGRVLSCPPIVTGQYLTALLGLASVTLGSAIPLKDGTALRSFRYVGPNDTLHDLGSYNGLFLSNRQWYGRIEPTQGINP